VAQRIKAPLAACFACAGALVVLVLAAAALVGASVVVIEWHFPSDVLGGILVAAGWGFAAVAALRLARPPGPAAPAQSSRRFAIAVK